MSEESTNTLETENIRVPAHRKEWHPSATHDAFEKALTIVKHQAQFEPLTPQHAHNAMCVYVRTAHHRMHSAHLLTSAYLSVANHPVASHEALHEGTSEGVRSTRPVSTRKKGWTLGLGNALVP